LGKCQRRNSSLGFETDPRRSGRGNRVTLQGHTDRSGQILTDLALVFSSEDVVSARFPLYVRYAVNYRSVLSQGPAPTHDQLVSELNRILDANPPGYSPLLSSKSVITTELGAGRAHSDSDSNHVHLALPEEHPSF